MNSQARNGIESAAIDYLRYCTVISMIDYESRTGLHYLIFFCVFECYTVVYAIGCWDRSDWRLENTVARDL